MMVRARSVDFVLYFALKVILTTSVRRCGIRATFLVYIACLWLETATKVAHDTDEVLVI